MSVSVFHGDNTVYASYYGYADRETGIVVDRNTVFEWGSATKSLVWISGEDFAEYVHRHIFEPLGMEHSALAVDLGDNPWVQEKRKELGKSFENHCSSDLTTVLYHHKIKLYKEKVLFR